MRYFYLALVLWLSAVAGLSAQSCGRSDTTFIRQNRTTNIDIPISDYFNNDLANPTQGLCGIELYFTHQFVEDLEMFLISPSGQSIQLTGPNTGATFTFTIATRWRVTFIPSTVVAEPDSGFVARWDHEQTANFVNGGLYTGSYYPFSGNLEDFNNGSVNGIWRLSIRNNPGLYAGAVTFVRLIFCDSRGVDCCFARPGELTADNVVACQGSDSLLIDPAPVFRSGRSDSTDYDYAYLIGYNGIFQRMDTLVDLQNEPAGSYEICGLSYRRDFRDSLYQPDGQLTMDSIRANLGGFFPRFCGKLTPECLAVNIVPPPDTTFLSSTICLGDSVVVGGQPFTTTGLYHLTLPTAVGCDSIVQLDLEVVPPLITSLDTILCAGESIAIGLSIYDTSGVYSDTLQSAGLGCDSIVNLRLTVLEPIETNVTAAICQGNSYQIGDSLFQRAGNYEIPLTSALGCDSLVRLTLSVFNPQASIAPPQVLTCSRTSVTLDGTASGPSGGLSYRWLDSLGNVLGTDATQDVGNPGLYRLEVSQTEQGITCTAVDSVRVDGDTDPPVANAGPRDTVLTCAFPRLVLGGVNTSTGANFTHRWQSTDGRFVGATNQPGVTVSAPGTYTLQVTDTSNGCVAGDTIRVDSDQQLPVADAGADVSLSCAKPQRTIGGTGTSTGSEFTYAWERDGQPLASLTTATPAVNLPGLYVLTVTDTLTGCLASDSVTVSLDTVAPLAAVPSPDTLNCYNATITLDAAPSTPAGMLTYSWSGPGIVSGQTGLTATVDQAGAYQLVVQRTDNGCRDSITINVASDFVAPVADAGLDTVLNCFNPSIILDGPTTSQGARYRYGWFSVADPSVQLADEPSLSVDQVGSYYLMVTDTVNGCRDTSGFVIVSGDFDQPPVFAGDDQTINCGNRTVTLIADSLLYTDPVDLRWTGPCLLGASDGWTARADCAGDYTLTVTRRDNGCSRDDVVRVFLVNDDVQAVLADTAFIDCETGTAVLPTAGTSSGNYSWLLDGQPISLLFPDPEVTQAGEYQLVVTNLTMTCSDTAAITVVNDCGLIARIAPADTLTCVRQSVWLDGSASSAGVGISYRWLAPAAGCIIAGQDSVRAEVTCPGDYRLIVDQPLLGLSDTALVSVVIDTLPPVAEAGADQQLTCSQSRVMLSATGSSAGPEFSYRWTNLRADTLSDIATLDADSPGTYLLEVTNQRNGCQALDQVQVTLAAEVPTIVFGSNIFPCSAQVFDLQAFVTPANDDYVVSWTGPDIIGHNDSLVVVIGAIGDYRVTVQDPLTSCTATATVTVEEQTCVPCLELVSADTLTCAVQQVTIAANYCRPCVGCTAQWYDADGPVAGETGLSLTVSEPGAYRLLSTDTLGFTTELVVSVVQLTDPPVLSPAPDAALTCDSAAVTIGLPVNDPDYQYNWAAESGRPLPITNRPTIQVSVADLYLLTVTDQRSGCSAVDTVAVIADAQPPRAEAGSNAMLTCSANFVALDGSSSSLGGDFRYRWTGPAAGCLEGENSINAVAGCSGLYTLTVINERTGCRAQDTVRVSAEAGLPQLNPVGDVNFGCDSSSVELVTTIPAQAGSFSYQWCEINAQGDALPSTCESELTYTVTRPGRYRFTLTNDATGCSNSFISTVRYDTIIPQVEAGLGDTLVCGMDSLLLQANVTYDGAYSLNWTSADNLPIANSTTLTPTVYAPGWYYVTVRGEANACVNRDSVFISRDQNAPILTLLNPHTTLDCSHSRLLFNMNATNAGPNRRWEWTTTDGNIVTGADLPRAIVDRIGTYVVRMTNLDNNCSALTSITVDSNYRRPQAILSHPTTFVLKCGQTLPDTILLDGSPSLDATGEGLSYIWETTFGSLFSADDPAQTYANSAGRHRLVVVDRGNSCRDSTDFITIVQSQPPAFQLPAPPDLNCERTTVNLQPQGLAPGYYEYSWRDSSGQVISIDSLLPVSAPGLYFLSVRDTATNCVDTLNTTVLQDLRQPGAGIETIGSFACENASVRLNGLANPAIGPLTYSWTTTDGRLLSAADLPQATAGAPGTYLLTVIDQGTGCDTTVSTLLTAEGNPITNLDIETTDPLCFGENSGRIQVLDVLGGAPPYRYALGNDKPGANAGFGELAPGTYTIRVFDSQGCSGEQTVTLVGPPELDVDLGEDLSIRLGDSIRLSAIVSAPFDTLRWISKGPIPTPGLPDLLVRPQETVTYAVLITDANGCTAADTLRIFVDRQAQLFTPTIFSPNGDNQNDFFTLYAGGNVGKINALRIYNRWGDLVFEKLDFLPNDPFQGWDGTLNGQPLNPAVFIYVAEVELSDGHREVIRGDVVLMR